MKRKFLSAPALLIAMVLFNNPTQAQVKNERRNVDLPKSINISSINSDASDKTEMNYTQDGRRYKVLLNGSTFTEMYVEPPLTALTSELAPFTFLDFLSLAAAVMKYPVAMVT